MLPDFIANFNFVNVGRRSFACFACFDKVNIFTDNFNIFIDNFNKQIIPPTPHIETTDGENNNIRKPIMILPYAGEKGFTLIKSLKKNLQRVLPVDIQTRII